MNFSRIAALIQRHGYLYRRSAPRLMEIFFWPLMDLLVWGFITLYFAQSQIVLPRFVTFFLGALILWDILYRAQQGISISFLEEVWSKNLLNLFVSPMRPCEFLVALMTISVAKMLVAGAASAVVAWFFYSFNFFIIGISLIPFVFNLLIMGWAIGIISMSAILRYGQQAEVLAWGLGFLIQPFAAVFYPVSVLPGWIQPIAHIIPASHIFEGMRAVLENGIIPYRELGIALFLNGIYLSASIYFFYYNLRVVKEKGLLLHRGVE
ncbi:MAG: ABC transporter permease [Nitrospirota bacterium]